ncbi:hypothetical protein ACW9KT_19300 [Hymenobacter sp. HD11105]
MWKASIVAVIGIGILGLGFVLFDPYFFTPAQTLYAIGLQKTDYASDNINLEEQKEGAYYFEKALAKGYRERKVYAMLLSTYSHIAPDNTREQMLTGALADYPQDAEFFFWRADSRMGQQKFRLAIHDYSQVITNQKAHRGYQEGALFFRGRRGTCSAIPPKPQRTLPSCNGKVGGSGGTTRPSPPTTAKCCNSYPLGS